MKGQGTKRKSARLTPDKNKKVKTGEATSTAITPPPSPVPEKISTPKTPSNPPSPKAAPVVTPSTKRKAVKKINIKFTHNKKPKPVETTTPKTPKAVAKDMSSPNIGEMTTLGSRVRGKGDGLGCSLTDLGLPDKKALMVSLYVRHHMPYFQNVKLLRKDVGDYIFLDDHHYEPGEIVASYSEGVALRRCELQTLCLERELSPSVVDAWSVLLNELEFNQPSVPSRTYLGIGHNAMLMNICNRDKTTTLDVTEQDQVFDFWNAFEDSCVNKISWDVDFIFVPVKYKRHYFCVCVNFISQKIEIIDCVPKRITSVDKTFVYRMAKEVGDLMSDFLETKNFEEKASLVTRFQVSHILLLWQTTTHTDVESGKFLLMHMLDYEGQSYDSDIGKMHHRRTLSLEIVATLLLADVNNKRDVLLENVNKFVQDKPSIFKAVNTKRQLVNLARREAKLQAQAASAIGAVQTEIPILRSTEEAVIGKGRGKGRASGHGHGRGRGL